MDFPLYGVKYFGFPLNTQNLDLDSMSAFYIYIQCFYSKSILVSEIYRMHVKWMTSSLD